MEFQDSIYGKKIPYMELKFHIWNFQMDDFNSHRFLISGQKVTPKGPPDGLDGPLAV